VWRRVMQPFLNGRAFLFVVYPRDKNHSVTKWWFNLVRGSDPRQEYLPLKRISIGHASALP